MAPDVEERIATCAETKNPDPAWRERLVQACRETIETKVQLQQPPQAASRTELPVRETASAEQVETNEHKDSERARAEMLKSLKRLDLGPDHLPTAQAIIRELSETDPDWFKRTPTGIQFDEIAILVQERLNGRSLGLSRDEAIIGQLTEDEGEQLWLRYMRRAFPKLKNNRRSLEMWLATYREYSHRYEVNTIKMKHLYPNASESELQILAQDATVTELQQKAKEEEREAKRRNETFMAPDYGLMFPPSIHCTSSRLGMFTNTDCY